MKEVIDRRLSAPCGMNCGVCSSYLAWSHSVPKRRGKTSYCTGCRPRDKKCAFIKRECPALLNHAIEFCFECSDFSCHKLQRLDERYRKNYKMSMIENLEEIRRGGIRFSFHPSRRSIGGPDAESSFACTTADAMVAGRQKAVIGESLAGRTSYSSVRTHGTPGAWLT